MIDCTPFVKRVAKGTVCANASSVSTLLSVARIAANESALPANVPKQSSLAYLNHQNSTNLHFHGLHVDPKEIRPGVFGDYVVDVA